MRLLFLENHAAFAKVVMRQFLAEHQVTLVPDLAGARMALASGVFDVVLVDYDLDDGKGDALVRECRAMHPRLPIVAVSSHEKGNQALIAAGANVACEKLQFARIGEVLRKLPSG